MKRTITPLPLPGAASLATGLAVGALAYSPPVRAQEGDRQAPRDAAHQEPTVGSAPVSVRSQEAEPTGPGHPAAAPEVPGEPPPEVVVVGTRIGRTAGSAHVIGEAELRRFELDDPHRVLVSAPGVYFRGEDGFGLRPNVGIRGVNPDRSKKLTLLEDGVPLAPAVYSAPAAYYMPLVTRMVAVRVVKGPGAIAYGPQTVGGTVDLRTRSIPAATGGEVDLAAGQYGYGKVHAWFGGGEGDLGVLIEGVHLRSSGFKELPSGDETGFVRNEWMVKTSWTPPALRDAGHRLELKLGYSDEDSRETYLGLTDADLRAGPDRRYSASQLDRMTWHRTAVALTHRFEPQPRVRITTVVYRSDLERTWRKLNRFRGASLFDVLRDPESPRNAVFVGVLRGESDSGTPAEALLIGPNHRVFASEGVETRVGLEARHGGIEHRLEYGVRLHRDRVQRRHSEDAFLVLGGQLFPEGTPTAVTAFNEASSTALSLHVIDAVTWGPVTVTPGARVEVVGSRFEDRLAGSATGRSFAQWLPGVGAFVALTQDFGLLAGAYRGFSPPAPGSDRTVSPELSVNYEGGLRLDRKRLRLEAIGFWNDYQNLTDVCTFSSGCLDRNLDRQLDAGRARIRGVEIFARAAVPAGSLDLPVQAAYTLTEASFLRSFLADDPIYGTVQRGDELPYVPRHQLSAQLGLDHERFGLASGLTYVSAMREEPGTTPLERSLATDKQLTLDASARGTVQHGFDVYLQVRNVLGDRHLVSRRPFGARPDAPRWVQLGARIAF